MQILYLFEKIRNPIFDFFFSTITYLGDELALMLIAIILFWCVNKRSGYYMLVSGFFGIIVNQVMKLACKIPRPWVVDPNFTIVESAREAATGYSFPSGHTQNAVTVFGSLFLVGKKKWFKITCLSLATLVGVSRMYLGVHTIWDVVAAAGCAVVILLLLEDLFLTDEVFHKWMPYLSAALALGSIAFFLYACIFTPETSDANVVSARKNSMTLLGCAAGLLVVYPLDRCVIKFENKSSWYVHVIKVVLGFVIVLLIKELVKIPLTALLGQYERPVRYFIIILFGGAGWPYMFRYLNKIKIPALDRFGEKVKVALCKKNSDSKNDGAKGAKKSKKA